MDLQALMLAKKVEETHNYLQVECIIIMYI